MSSTVTSLAWTSRSPNCSRVAMTPSWNRLVLSSYWRSAARQYRTEQEKCSEVSVGKSGSIPATLDDWGRPSSLIERLLLLTRQIEPTAIAGDQPIPLPWCGAWIDSWRIPRFSSTFGPQGSTPISDGRGSRKRSTAGPSLLRVGARPPGDKALQGDGSGLLRQKDCRNDESVAKQETAGQLA
jgi:hypothetical protein